MNDPFLAADGVKTETDAMRMSLVGALQRNRTYRHGSPQRTRMEFRDEWARLIRDESRLYSHAAQPVSDGEHCLAIERISNGLLPRFAQFLINGRLRFGTSQKAFNLYLKYIWRLNIDTRPPPPHCPVDGIVLAAAGISGSWTKCDSVQEYMSWIDRLRMEAKAKSQSLAEWEYQVWLESALNKRSAAS